MTPYEGEANDRSIIDGTLTTGEKVMSHDTEARRRKLYKWAVGLSIIYVVDGIFMAWALLNGAYAFPGYAALSYIPLFMPALIAGLVVSGVYAHGFVRRGWKARKAEWFFFFFLADAVAAKVIVIVHRHCCQ